eukprot:scaffold2910_cov112-Isochrysis_galbana.AAC.5
MLAPWAKGLMGTYVWCRRCRQPPEATGHGLRPTLMGKESVRTPEATECSVESLLAANRRSRRLPASCFLHSGFGPARTARSWFRGTAR